MVALPLHKTSEADYGDEQAELEQYREEGTRRALAMDNRGPIKFDDQGRLDQAILDAYSKCGFYVFTDVLSADERADLEKDLTDVLERAPVNVDSKVDKHGRPALGSDCEGRTVTMVKPLSDPVGGTEASHGRHQVKMFEPKAPEDAPEYVLQLLLGSLQFSDAHLRLYGHPQLLAVAAAINGNDFTPFNEAIWIKHPHLGGSVSWHQDGWTHWDNPDLEEDTHGFNFMAQLYGCDAANGLWVVPGTHKLGKVDIKAMAEEVGSDRLPNAVPLICGPGDVAIVNRQAAHGSFANTSPNIRVTFNLGFHKRASVLDVESGGVHNPIQKYTADYIRERSKVISYAIDARQQRFPDEAPYRYEPLADAADELRWNDAARAKIKDYNLKDLGI